jgi:hypothetical protein
MIEPFEAALADLLADRVGPHPAVAVVTRWRDGMADPLGDEARVAVLVHDAQVSDELGGDRDEELRGAGDISLRSSLRLAGQARITVEVATTDQAGEQAGQRSALVAAADAVLVALHDDDVRTGRAWGDDHDQGFAIDRFRLARLGHLDDPPDQFRRLDIWCGYAGRFWPTEPLVEGDLIAAPIRVRSATLDPVLPMGVRAVGGGADVVAPVVVDLRTLGGADRRLVARLSGAAPPGTLVGDTVGVPEGSVAYSPTDPADPGGGRFEVVFRPAAVLAGAAVARVVLSLAGGDHPTVRLGEFEIAVEA